MFVFSTLLSLIVFGTADVSAEFYVIAGSRGVGTEIKSLPYTISSPGFYYITKDLSCTEGHGITITADNVTLDLMGFGIIGPGCGGDCAGIYMAQRTNVEIRNGTVRDFNWHGIYEGSTGGAGNRIIHIRARNNGNSGIDLNSMSTLVEGCTALGNGSYGIRTNNASTITGNICYLNGGIGLAASGGSTVTGNTSFNNTSFGIIAGDGSTISGNTCYSNSDGIYTGNASTITGNTCYDNTNYGIYAVYCNLIDQNATCDNGTNIQADTGCILGTNVDASTP